MTATGHDDTGTGNGYGAGLFDHRIPLETRRLRAMEEYNDLTTRAIALARGL